MSKADIQVAKFEDGYDVDEVGIYSGGDLIISGSFSEMDPFSLLNIMKSYIDPYVDIERVALTEPPSGERWLMPEQLGWDDITDEYVAPWDERNTG